MSDLTGQSVLIVGRLVQDAQVLVLYNAQDRRVAVEPSPGACAKLLELAAEQGVVKALCLYDQRRD